MLAEKFEDMPVVKAFQKWDKHLLLNHPRLWALRLPLLVIYLIAANAIALLVSGLIPLKTYQVNYMYIWLWLFGLLELILLILWIRHFNQHSPEKALEHTNPLNGMVEVLIYMLAVAVILSPAISSSFLLVQRFSGLLPAAEIRSDQLIIRDFDYPAVYPSDLVEKYSPLDYDLYLAAVENDGSHWIYNRNIRDTVNELNNCLDGESLNWKVYLTIGIVLLHIGVAMFLTRHLRKGVFGRVVIYAILIWIAAFILLAVGDSLISFFISGNYSQRQGYFKILSNSVAGAAVAFIFFFSIRVFWQKRYRRFTAMNISVLPYLVYFLIFYLNNAAPETFHFINDLFSTDSWLSTTFGYYWGDILSGLIVATPVMILWVFIPIKAMFTRLLALPEG
jgi:hypothetical protein